MIDLRHVAATVAATFVLAGCGDSSGAPTTTAADQAADSPTRQEFIRQADKLCGEYDRRTAPFDEDYADARRSGDTAKAADAIEGVTHAATDHLAKLRALEPPPDDRVPIGKYLDVAAEQIGLGRRLADAIRGGDGTRAEALADELRRGGERAEGLAQGYGFKECGSGD